MKLYFGSIFQVETCINMTYDVIPHNDKELNSFHPFRVHQSYKGLLPERMFQVLMSPIQRHFNIQNQSCLLRLKTAPKRCEPGFDLITKNQLQNRRKFLKFCSRDLVVSPNGFPQESVLSFDETYPTTFQYLKLVLQLKSY